MKPLFCFKTIAFSAAVVFCLSSCERTTRTETNTEATDRDTVTVSRTETTTKTKADDEVRDFQDWVNDKTNRADSNAKEKWPEVKEDFKTRSAQLDAKMDSFSADTRREYEAAKARYQAWENRRDTRTSRPLDNAHLSSWRNTLLGNFGNLKTVTATNVKEVYLTFMGAVRAKKANWTQEDWDYVDQVYGELNQRKREIDNAISTTDAVKIKTLQAEYLTLEASADAQDVTR
ncbi:hypothetical protein I5M27_13480 [Adhaeribacter sp. BT258]|uniref:DUF349 domain-containing protein n=1 Tax=Adhaeribacter terrigena TaxID=2793070 RepID=A0ABS1C605_9BACT|nr:hypothetical protein [Adhaeribacter terrigena]MBK0404000.1 hypothetical protein [Adhaeribacter terrigena]